MKRIVVLLVGLIFGTAALSPLAAQGYIEKYLQDEKPIYISGYRSYLDIKGTFDEFDSSSDACLHLITSHGYLHREWLYAGGGTGLTLQPIGFLVINAAGEVEMINVGVKNPADPIEQIADLIERSPDIIARIKTILTAKDEA